MPRTPSSAPHLLYVAWSYPPARSAGMYRALATTNAFARAGWDVTVLTADRETYERLTGTDAGAEKTIDPRVRIHRIPFDPERGETDLRRWSRWRVYSPLLWNYLRWVIARLGFPEVGYASWRTPLARAARQIHAEHPVDLVIGSANPNVDFVPGDVLYRSARVPYVMDHRDAWHLNVYTGKRVGGRFSRSARLERRMLRHALEAWFVNDPIRDWHAQELPERAADFHVVANGYDPGFLDPTRTRPPDPEHGLVFGYLGTIYGPIPLEEALQGWREARARSPLVARSRLEFRGRLGHFAEADAVAASLLERYRDDAVSYAGPVSKTGVSEVYQGFDALLLIISHSRYVTSGKVFEYAATGLPITSIHHPETGATRVLAGRPEWFPVAELTVDDIARALIETAEAAARMTPEDFAAAREWSARYARDEQLMPRIAALTERVGGRA